jgi:hypothetical protein
MKILDAIRFDCPLICPRAFKKPATKDAKTIAQITSTPRKKKFSKAPGLKTFSTAYFFELD